MDTRDIKDWWETWDEWQGGDGVIKLWLLKCPNEEKHKYRTERSGHSSSSDGRSQFYLERKVLVWWKWMLWAPVQDRCFCSCLPACHLLWLLKNTKPNNELNVHLKRILPSRWEILRASEMLRLFSAFKWKWLNCFVYASRFRC